MPLRLVVKNVTKHWVRSLLTVGALVVAVALLCVLRSLVWTLERGVREAEVNRLITQSSVSLFVYLPEAYEAKIEQVEGVERVCRWNWFGGYYQEPSNFFAQFATDPADFVAMYPEIEILEGSAEDFLRERQACIIGVDTARKYGFHVGQSVPIIGALFPRTDGDAWQFKVAGIYHSRKMSVDNNTMFFHADYLQKALEAGEGTGPRGVGVYVVRLAPGADRIQVAADIDALFAGGPQKTQTTTEAEFQAQFVSMIGNIPFFVAAIGTGVLLAILLATVNTMLMAAREQTRDVGILKALGFGGGTVFTLMLAQSFFLCGVGGALGLVVAKGSEPVVAELLGTVFPGYAVVPGTLALGAVLTLGLALFAGLAPAWRAGRLQVVDCLRRGA